MAIKIIFDKASEYYWLRHVIDAGCLKAQRNFLLEQGVPTNQNVNYVKSPNFIIDDEEMKLNAQKYKEEKEEKERLEKERKEQNKEYQKYKLINRFMGIMPRNEIEIEKYYRDIDSKEYTIQAGPHGWTIVYPDKSTKYDDNFATSEENFKIAYTYLTLATAVTEIKTTINEE